MSNGPYPSGMGVDTGMLPNRTDSDIPLQVRLFLSICEVAIGSARYQEENLREPQTMFCEGVVDYWWDEKLDEPYWEQIFRRNLSTGELDGFPSHERFCYQQGAILGYKLREEFRDE